VYDEMADKRRKVAAKRTQERLVYYRGLLERLLDSIRFCEPDHVSEIINVIRSGGALKEISTEVDRRLGERRVIEALQRAMGDDEDDGSDILSGIMED
jgi:hypothetical protein